MKRSLLLLPLLAACATPQQQCISQVTKDLTVVDLLIAETKANLSRGYALEDKTVYTSGWEFCDDWGGGWNDDGGYYGRGRSQMCWETYPQTVDSPVAVDLAGEQRKLDGLRVKRSQLEKSSAAGIAQCRATYPE